MQYRLEERSEKYWGNIRRHSGDQRRMSRVARRAAGSLLETNAFPMINFRRFARKNQFKRSVLLITITSLNAKHFIREEHKFT